MVALLLAVVLDGPPQNPQELMAKVAEQAREDTRRRFGLAVAGTKKQQTRDNGGIPMTEQWRIEATADGTAEIRTFTNGAPIIGAPPERPALDFAVAMRTRYRLHLVNTEPIDGCYSVAFEPDDPDGHPARDDQEAIMNHLSGIACVDVEHLYIRHIQAWLSHGFGIHGIGRVQEASVVVEQELVDDVPVPRRSETTVRFSRFFGIAGSTTRHISIEYEYDPIVSPAPSSS